MLRAMDATGRPCVVKVLNMSVSLDCSEQPEAAAILRVCDASAVQAAIPVLQAELISLYLSADHRSARHGPGNYAAIVMPQYCGSVAAQLQMSEAAIEAGGRRMVQALEHMHSKNLVHMDVKVQSVLLHHVAMSIALTLHLPVHEC